VPPQRNRRKQPPEIATTCGLLPPDIGDQPDNLEAKIGLSEVLYWTGNSEAAAPTLKGVPEDKLDDKGKLMLADLFVAKKPKLSPWGYAARIDANRQILTERYSSFL
jgi:hypothetical protein